jgi:Na+/H+ antiporter NhaC
VASIPKITSYPFFIRSFLTLFFGLYVSYFSFAQIDTASFQDSASENFELQYLDVRFLDLSGTAYFLIHASQDGNSRLSINGEEVNLEFNDKESRIKITPGERGKLYILDAADTKKLYHVSKRSDGTYRFRKIPMWLSILPPVVAIFLALLFREVVVSLFIGIWAGSFIAGGMRIESLYYFVLSLLDTLQNYVVKALTDADSGHLAVIVFSLFIGGMVAIISKNGGMAGVVKSLSRYAKSDKSSQLITWVLGVAIFFDDYANTLIVGNTMRSVTDRFRVSREKLAYIVDSTAAPVAAVAFITTWIGAELGYIDDGIHMIDGFNFEMTSYSIFISSLKYSFYPVLTLIFILLLIRSGRDYGPMWHAEVRARKTGQVSSAATTAEDEPNMEDLGPVKGAPFRWYNAVIPVLTVILMTVFGLLNTGMEKTYGDLLDSGIILDSSTWSSVWHAIPQLIPEADPSIFQKIGKLIGNADSYTALLWASLSGVVVAIFLTVSQKIISLFDTMHHLATGFKTMMPAIIILTLAWSLAITTEELHTADYLTSLLKDTINPYFMPTIIFVLAASISFSTGSSWSTMAILYPIAIPTTWAICQANGVDPQISLELLLNVISTVLAASVLGDHCSPISDTTILSSLASDCNHIDHVRTQLPYALTVGILSILAGTIATFLGGGWGISFVLGCTCIVLMWLIIRKFGSKLLEQDTVIQNII